MLIYFLISTLLFPTISEQLENNSEVFQEIVEADELANSYTFTLDTLFRIRDISKFIPEWNQQNLGIDIHFLQTDSTEYWQALLLIDSQLVRISENEIDPSIYQIGGFPSSMSISRNASFVLSYQHVFAGDTVRNLNLIDIKNNNVYNVVDYDPVNLASEQNGAVVTENGHVITYGFGESRLGTISWFENGNLNRIHQRFSDNFGWLPIHSETSNRIVAARKNSHNSAATVIVYDSSLDTVACFDSGRSYLQLCVDNSGNTILYANEFGIGNYSIPEQRIVSNVHLGPTSQVPVVSASDIYWACSFQDDFEWETKEEEIAVGLLADFSTTRVVYRNTSNQFNNPVVLSVSDSGFILCSIVLSDQRFPKTYFYLLLNPDGKPVWLSDAMCKAFWKCKVTANSEMPLIEANPKQIAISSSTDKIIYYSNGNIIQVVIQVQ